VARVRARYAVHGGELPRPPAGAAPHRHDLDGLGAAHPGEHLLVDVRGGEDPPAHGLPHALPEAALLRRDTESSVTAASSTMPVTMNFVDELTFSRPSPLSIIAITTAPRIALRTAPRPPNRLVPPITQAAIE